MRISLYLLPATFLNCIRFLGIMFDLELDRVVGEINKSKADTVCIQLPDGLKPKAAEMQVKLEKDTNSTIFFWAGTCFGACDIPELDVDLLVHYGHSEWK